MLDDNAVCGGRDWSPELTDYCGRSFRLIGFRLPGSPENPNPPRPRCQKCRMRASRDAKARIKQRVEIERIACRA